MKTAKPLSYDSLKKVITYLEPNLRIMLSVKLPAIRVAEKAVPFKVESMKMEQYLIKLNDTEYSLSVVRYDEEEIDGVLTPCVALDHEDWNYNLLFGDTDVDKYGFAVGRQEPTPGDLRFDPLQIVRSTEEEILDSLREEKAASKTKNSKTKSDYMVYLETLLADYELRRNGSEPPYTNLLRFAVSTNNDLTYIHSVYKQNLQPLWKFFVNTILGGQRPGGPIRVRKLEIEPIGCIRLPEDFEVNFSNLSDVKGRNYVQIMRKILSGSQIPLESIESPNLAENHYEMFRTAEKFVFHPHSERTFSLAGLRHTRIHILCENPSNVIGVINTIRNERWEIGTYISIEMKRDFLQELKNKIVEELQIKKKSKSQRRFSAFRNCIIIPIDNGSEIFAYATVLKGSCGKFILKIKIQQIRF